MILRKIIITCLLSVLMIGIMSTALPAAVPDCTVVKNQKVEQEWTLLETKNGVSCYYHVGPLGTCNNAVLLRFMNNSSENVTINFSVSTDGATINRKITLAAGQTLDGVKDQLLTIRPTSSGTPAISFIVSK